MTVTNYDGRLEQMALYCEAMLDNLAKVNNAYKDVNNDAYSVTLPDNMIKFKGLKKVGGKTIVIDNNLISAGVTEVVSKDSNNATLQTYSIPAEVQALEGYGWSAGTAYNYVDFERKVFAKNVGKIILDGTQTIKTVNWVPTDVGQGWIYAYSLTNNKPTGYYDYPNAVCDKLLGRTYPQIQNEHLEGFTFTDGTNNGLIIYSHNKSLTNATAINAYLSANPITVYYELATPIEVDISQYLTDDNLIQVEAGGTLTFVNQHGDDYQIQVPSEIEYIGVT